MNLYILLIIYWIFIASTAIQIIYFWGIFSRFAFKKKKKKLLKEKQGVSVIICAKNEYYNLKNNLTAFLQQDYPNFEVIVVNDASEDETYSLLKTFSIKYSNLKVVNIDKNLNFFSGKKFPLSIGIKSAKNEIVLLSDADCRPSSAKWISNIASHFNNDNTEIVLGYGKYEERKGLLNKLIRYETLQTAMQYFSYALMGLPYMGVGRNLAYKKELFFKNRGFTAHYNVNSGDDDLFINAVANRKNTKIEFDESSHTISVPKTSFFDWITQKKRHLSTSKYYQPKHKLLLGLYSLTQFLFYLSFIILLINKYFIIIVLPVFAFRIISQLIINYKCSLILKERKFLLYSPIFEVFLIVLYPVIYIFSMILKKDKWK